MAAHNFNKRQSYEREIKELYSLITVNEISAAAGELATSEPVILTSVALGEQRNGTTFTLQVAAAAANPTDTVLAVFTGTAAAIICTITPNDGTNNTATPVDLTTEELAELITSGAVVGKTVTITDASSLRAKQTATGGDSTPLADAGEGDGEVATFADAENDMDISVDRGVSSIVRNDVGDYTIDLGRPFAALKCMRATMLSATAIDRRFQIHTDSVSSAGTIRFMILSGATKADPADGDQFQIKLDVKDE